VRVGLEDAPLGTDSRNRGLVEGARRRIAEAGGSIAGANDVRKSLGALGLRTVQDRER
jgi:uncharacterized protein (DUF849 family)